jgi:hypothetical protein
MSEEPARPTVTFIVRIARDRAGRLCGTVERVRTGETERFTGADGLGESLERMLGWHDDRRRRRRQGEDA